ncbi:MAG: hypothetical protein WD403_10755 [Pirellulales bacterium]
MPAMLAMIVSSGCTAYPGPRQSQAEYEAGLAARGLVKRELMFRHLSEHSFMILSAQADELFPAAEIVFDIPDNSLLPPGGRREPCRLIVWDHPSRMPHWEAFRDEHDVVDFEQRFLPVYRQRLLDNANLDIDVLETDVPRFRIPLLSSPPPHSPAR